MGVREVCSSRPGAVAATMRARGWTWREAAVIVGAAVVVVGLAGCVPKELSTPTPTTVDLTPQRQAVLDTEPLESIVPTGLTVRSASSDATGLGDVDLSRSWSFDAPDDATAVAGAQQILAQAAADGWTITSSGSDPETLGSWSATATKRSSAGPLSLEVFAATAAWATEIGHAGGAFVLVTTTLGAGL